MLCAPVVSAVLLRVALADAHAQIHSKKPSWQSFWEHSEEAGTSAGRSSSAKARERGHAQTLSHLVHAIHQEMSVEKHWKENQVHANPQFSALDTACSSAVSNTHLSIISAAQSCAT